ncbi:hypothetical protein ABN028_19825 [Actinopolymorpha sp. B17G11]|uniref:hypothetical protein n=1 Tax=Actinopolymorpha sp. B17G11 TaxID=3160861 RepID=UPI0032E44AD1
MNDASLGALILVGLFVAGPVLFITGASGVITEVSDRWDGASRAERQERELARFALKAVTFFLACGLICLLGGGWWTLVGVGIIGLTLGGGLAFLRHQDARMVRR